MNRRNILKMAAAAPLALTLPVAAASAPKVWELKVDRTIDLAWEPYVLGHYSKFDPPGDYIIREPDPSHTYELNDSVFIHGVIEEDGGRRIVHAVRSHVVTWADTIANEIRTLIRQGEIAPTDFVNIEVIDFDGNSWGLDRPGVPTYRCEASEFKQGFYLYHAVIMWEAQCRKTHPKAFENIVAPLERLLGHSRSIPWEARYFIDRFKVSIEHA